MGNVTKECFLLFFHPDHNFEDDDNYVSLS